MATTSVVRRASFVDQALSARVQMLKTRKGYDPDEVHAYLKARISGKNKPKPKARAWQC